MKTNVRPSSASGYSEFKELNRRSLHFFLTKQTHFYPGKLHIKKILTQRRHTDTNSEL